ncbi:AAA family ATPase [Mycetocola miduiensis]|uniref:AAA domain-containing protein n=1 Tax=Mycetocola miduiensis TaxID=995034 RepID=A0A1I5AWX5_9MICO|nr:AAA family ATPase [Mycetocola miduiensis]SFN66944.1 AAA domain-containing protein [Mycetocola miduiensis]
MTLQIVNLQAENYKRVKAVNITPEGNVVFIGGRNAQGKTSVLDAIWAALAGGDASRATQQPIRDGQETAVVRLDLGEYIVTRRWTKDDSGTLTVESGDGAKYSSPQKLLDEVVGARAFDPLAFTRQSARDQVATLVSTVKLPFDPAAVERERKGMFDTRTEVKREVTKLEGQLAGFAPTDETLPAEEVSAASVLDEYEEASQHNAAIDRLYNAAADAQTERENAAKHVAKLEEQLDAARTYLTMAIETEETTVAKAAASVRKDLAAISARLASVEATNAKVRAQQHRAAVAAELSERKQRAAQLTIQLEQIDKRKAGALAAANFPVDGLSFDDSGVTYKGIPFSQASAAEQLRVSVALAMAANPTLRVLRILDGSLLDSDSLKIIGELATENDYQVWIEIVDESGKVGVVIEDGQVKA